MLGEFFRDDKLMQSFHNAYDKVWSEMEHRLTDPVGTEKESSRVKQFDEALNYMTKTVQKIVQHRKDVTTQGVLLIDDVVEFSESEEVVASDSITFLVGSFHTTGNLLTWCLYFLATHEEAQNKVYQEIMDVLGDNGLVNDSNLGKFKYTHQVLDESLRCGVVAPWAARFQEFDSELGGHKIPKNTPVIHALGVVLQDENLWPLPNKFDPDRFNEENSNNRHPYAFQPFGFAGKRKCPAYKYSYLEGTVVLATVLRRFKIKMHNEQVVLPVYGLVTHPAEEIWVQIIKR